jgi:nicotinamidase/pyrazinamidase
MKALILVDVQNDFLPAGALAVPHGDEVIEVANRAQDNFELIVATQDWHPKNHASFAANHPGKKPFDVIELDGLRQVLWPVHCVQKTPGAELASKLSTKRISRVFQKGTDPHIDSYSGFFDNGHRKSTGMGDYLRERGVRQIYLLGLATDYCVKFTALDARQLGFETFLLEDGCRGIDAKTTADAIEQMRNAGVKIVKIAELMTNNETRITNQ